MYLSIQKSTVKIMFLRRFSTFAHNRNGFSLVELMVVIAILAIIAGFSTPMLLSMRAKSSVRADARDVYSAFRHAQSEAVKRSENVSIFLDQTNGKFTVFVDNGAGGGTADNDLHDGDEPILTDNQLRASSSFSGISPAAWKPGFNARGLPLSGQGSVIIQSSALKMKLSLSNAGFINPEVVP